MTLQALLNELAKLQRGEPHADVANLRLAVAVLEAAPRSWADCVTFARRLFQSYFHDAPLQLMHVYPVTNNGRRRLSMADGPRMSAETFR